MDIQYKTFDIIQDYLLCFTFLTIRDDKVINTSNASPQSFLNSDTPTDLLFLPLFSSKNEYRITGCKALSTYFTGRRSGCGTSGA
ncbi:hypothetical protein Y032_0049g1868 [Ancylostoma ceylanicum]|uniref:Uncharacterized protein n=1 Tax=Ancylostoma ceylanicum TaxID=53326 RepID=A0A016UAI1_9BILA|nr:hypothetical protein Y032_0049g1868 [Ancylostoma ceylanicum]